jgi:hypothetical protein
VTGCPSASCNNEQMNILNPASAQAGCQAPCQRTLNGSSASLESPVNRLLSHFDEEFVSC